MPKQSSLFFLVCFKGEYKKAKCSFLFQFIWDLVGLESTGEAGAFDDLVIA